jgi:hypothetical protein
LPLELIATRLPDEEVFFTELTKLVHQLIGRMFSNEVITPGVTRTSDLVWWWRQQVNDLGLGTWFQPSIDVQRRGGDSRTARVMIPSFSAAMSCTATWA